MSEKCPLCGSFGLPVCEEAARRYAQIVARAEKAEERAEVLHVRTTQLLGQVAIMEGERGSGDAGDYPASKAYEAACKGLWKYRDRAVIAEADAERLRKRCIELSHAIDQIDCLLLPPEIVKRHMQDVGGPVSNYCVDYDEKAVVERVRKALAVKKIPDGETKREFAGDMHDCHGRWGTRREGLIAWLLRELDYRRR